MDPLSRNGLRLVGDAGDLWHDPLFRCDLCSEAWPIRFQWRTASNRFCSLCRPAQAIPSQRLELAS